MGSKKQEIIPIFSDLLTATPRSKSSALISSYGISVKTPAPSPVPSANFAPLWSKLDKHSRTFSVIP